MSNVRFAHANREPLLDGFNLILENGQTCLLEGPSGCGKSTLLDLASGTIPTVNGGQLSGTITHNDTPIHQIPPHQLPNRIGLVPQDPETAFVARSVHRELAGPLTNTNTPKHEIPRRIDQALHAFGALHLQDRDIGTLSGGEAARVALATALVTEPDLLLLDEPHAQLDNEGRQRLADTLRALTAGGRSALIAAHPPHPFRVHIDHTHTLAQANPPTQDTQLPPAPGGDPLLALDNVHHAYTDDQEPLGPFDFQIEPGEVVALTGPNGSGKTTALHAASGLIEPTHGTVHLQGEPPRNLSPTERAKRLGIAFQHPAWHITQDTLTDEITLTANQLNQPIDPKPWLALLGLDPLAHVHPWDLSGGERQRMAILTATAHQPPLALLDEPTRGLDPTNRERLTRLLTHRTNHGHATLIASHHPWIHHIAHRTITLPPPEPSDGHPQSDEVLYA